METRQRGFVLLVGLVCCFVLILVSYSENRFGSLGISWFRSDPSFVPSRGYLVDTIGCQMPNWDAFDSSIFKFYKKSSLPYLCSTKASFLAVEPNATIRLDSTTLYRIHHLDPDDITCHYKAILRDGGKPGKPNDNTFSLGPSLNLTFSKPIGEDFIHVFCSNNKGEEFHDEFLTLTPLKVKTETKCAQAERRHRKETQDKLNVIILGIDSISKLNFIRHFPLTRKLLQEELGAVELHGYNKVADNTFPNLVPLLTGHFVSFYEKNSSSLDKIYFDDLDLIWKHYAERGYRTLLAEDAPNIATFNYLRKGFKLPPTDYYYRPFALATEKSEMRKRSKEDCFDDRMELRVIYDYVHSFVQTMEDRPFFSFSFAARLTHDVLNKAARADFPSYRILKALHNSNVTNSSLVIFMSDHGIRFGPIRETYIGKFEERWPIMFLIFPDWFHKRYPEFSRNLRTNERRLTTPFDIHATLAHILDLKHHPFNSSSGLGISLFDEIPLERTCADAAILPHWCTCQRLKPVAPNSSDVQLAAEVLVHTLNNWLSNYSNHCAKLTLHHVMDAHLGQPGDEVLRFQRHPQNHQVEYGPSVDAPLDYLITLRTDPSDAVFEGTVRVEPIHDRRTVLGDVSRINLYGHQGDCINDAALRKYCYCKTQLVIS